MKVLATIELDPLHAEHLETLKAFMNEGVNGFNRQLRGNAKVASVRLLSEKRRRAIDDISLLRQRLSLPELVIQLTENLRADFLPFLTTWEFFETIMIFKTMCDLNEQDQEASVNNLARLTTIPIQMVEKRLKELLDAGAIENDQPGYAPSAAFFNNERLMRGFKLRRAIVSIASEKMADAPAVNEEVVRRQ